MPGIQQPNLQLDEALSDRLQRLADARRQSPEDLMRKAIEQYVDFEEDREQLNRDMVASWEDYQATGLHVTGEEVDAWLAKLEAGEDAEPPIPHK
ncbi:CopG family ribbon-helix-helix protein [Dongia sp.]|uniref:CopG family ribbon-helix-helix protein n=1 Tax=Dongia sp. TaxID=1977262 RepID=UPI0037501F65